MSIRQKLLLYIAIILIISFAGLTYTIIQQVSHRNEELIVKTVNSFETGITEASSLLTSSCAETENKLLNAEHSVEMVLEEVFGESFGIITRLTTQQLFPHIEYYDFDSANEVVEKVMGNSDDIVWAQYIISSDPTEDDIYNFGDQSESEEAMIFTHELDDGLTYVKFSIQLGEAAVQRFITQIDETFLSINQANKQIVEAVNLKSSQSMETSKQFAQENSAENLRQLIQLIVIIMIIMVIVIAVVIYFFTNSIIKPIEKDVKLAEEIASGDLTHELHTKRKDEFGVLGNALDQIVENLSAMIKKTSAISETIDKDSYELANIVTDENKLAETIVENINIIESDTQSISSSIQEITASLEEVSAASHRFTDTSENISNSANSSRAVVVKSSASANQIEQKMAEVNGEMNSTKESVQNLTSNLKNIGEILNSINAIAEQTNLLALNAAIEAARAGEAGKGFSVVADEIRKLAEESKGATEQVSRILTTISHDSSDVQQKTESVTLSVNQAKEISMAVKENLNELLSEIENMVVISQEGYELSIQQKETTDEIANAIESSNISTQSLAEKQIDIVEQINTLKDIIEKVEQSGVHMHESSQVLKKSLNEFNLQRSE